MHSNTVIDKKHANFPFRQTTAAINHDIGVAYLYTLDHACKNEEFVEFAEGLRKKYPRVPITFFADNLSQHHAAEDDLRNRLDIQFIFNKRDSPDWNPIEAVFAQAKLRYRKDKLNHLANDNPFDIDAAIERAFKKIPLPTIQNCIERSSRLLREEIE